MADSDSVTMNTLCNSDNGTFVTLDEYLPDTTFACWKIRFKTEVCTCSQFPTEAMQWIKEVELVDSVDESRSSSSIRGISVPNFEVLDARIASALN